MEKSTGEGIYGKLLEATILLTQSMELLGAEFKEEYSILNTAKGEINSVKEVIGKVVLNR